MRKDISTYRSNSVWDFMSDVERAFDEIWGSPTSAVANTGLGTRSLQRFTPSVDLKETPDNFLISLDVPGVSQKDINISAVDGRLTISGERQHEDHSEDGLFNRIYSRA